LKLASKKKSASVGESEKREKLFPIFSPAASQNASDDDTFEPPIPPPPYAGLKNHGNICFANAVLQVLRHCPGLMESVVEIDSVIKDLCRTVANANPTETERDGQAPEETDLCNGDNEDHKSVTFQLKELFSQMKDLEEDYKENKENCEHLVQRRNQLILAAKPLNFMETFRRQNPMFEDNLQHDAQEFLCSLLVNLQETESEIKTKVEDTRKVNNRSPNDKNLWAGILSCDNKGQGCSSLEELFHGRLLHQTKCLTCEDAKRRFENFQDISVPVKKEPKVYDAKKAHTFSPTPKKGQDSQSLGWALSQFATVEHLSGDNKYFCENCLTHTEAEISMCFDKLPRILTIHLKRFTANSLSGFLTGSVSKITSNLQTPMELSLKDWCSNSSSIAEPTFHLFGIVMHSGMTSCSGHYQAYVKVPKFNMAGINHNKQSIHLDSTHVPCSEYGNEVPSNMESSHLGESESFSIDDNAKSVGFNNTFSSNDKFSQSNQISSPKSPTEKATTTCISGITRYFHKSKKHSTKVTKQENHDEEKRGDLQLSAKKGRHHNTSRFSFTETEISLNKIQSFQYHDVASGKSAIRTLHFQDSKRQPDQAAQGQNATDSSDVEISESGRNVQETQAFQWVHFDDAEVAILEEADVLTLLTSSESSFTSPYLLFYKLAELCTSKSTV